MNNVTDRDRAEAMLREACEHAEVASLQRRGEFASGEWEETYVVEICITDDCLISYQDPDPVYAARRAIEMYRLITHGPEVVAAANPIREIVRRFHDDGLDEARPAAWGDTPESAANKEIYASRGGATLLTLGDCFRIEAALAHFKEPTNA